ncbi:UbiA family prenyltransferase [Methanobacterium movens]
MSLYLRQTNLYKYLDVLFNEIFYGGYYTALGSPLLILSVCIILNIKAEFPIFAISYLLPLIVYSYDYYKDLDKEISLNSDRAIFLSKKSAKFSKILSVYIILLLIMLFLFSSIQFIIFISGIILGGILYTTALKKMTKIIPFFKNFYTALTWAIGGTFFIIFYNSLSISTAFIIMFIFIFLRVLINIIFFDLKDIEGDKMAGLKTLPAMVGKKNSILFLHIINLISFLPLFFGVYYGILPLFALSLVGFYFYVYFYIRKSEKVDEKDLHVISHTMADSEFVIWPFVLLISQYLFF